MNAIRPHLLRGWNNFQSFGRSIVATSNRKFLTKRARGCGQHRDAPTRGRNVVKEYRNTPTCKVLACSHPIAQKNVDSPAIWRGFPAFYVPVALPDDSNHKKFRRAFVVRVFAWWLLPEPAVNRRPGPRCLHANRPARKTFLIDLSSFGLG